jgi:hypothetical protein
VRHAGGAHPGVQAKLEALDAGLFVFAHEFMAHLVLPGGETVADHIGPDLSRIMATGEMPPLLPKL